MFPLMTRVKRKGVFRYFQKMKILTNNRVMRLLMRIKKFSDYLLRLFQAPPGGRTERDIQAVLPIFMMKVACMRQLSRDTMVQILQNAYLQTCKEDDVIIRQGDMGEEFYVILTGSVSIYVDHKLEEKIGGSTDNTLQFPGLPQRHTSAARDQRQQDDLKSVPSAGSRAGPSAGRRELHSGYQSGQKRERRQTKSGKRGDYKSRKKQYGSWVNKLGHFQSFGELALIYPNNRRNATSVADEKTTLMVVKQEMFEAHLQDNLENDLEEKRIFIQTHPFFSKWNSQMQRQLQWSLLRTNHSIGDHVIRQGDKVSGLHFLIKGRSRLIAEPVRHRVLFPEFFEKPKVSPFDIPPSIAKEESTVSEIADSMRMSKTRKNILAGMDPLTYIRRTDGYAAAEKIVYDKQVDLCIIEEGEVICDTELLLNLDRNIFGVLCATDCTFFHLSTQIFDRLILKWSPHTLEMMKLLTETKLSRRISTKQGERVTILVPLLYRVLEIRVVDPMADADKNNNDLVKQSSKTVMLSRTPVMPKLDPSKTVLVDWFIRGRTPLLQPITKDAIYYREMIQQRAKFREFQRERGPKELKEVKSLARRIKDSYWVNMKETKRARNTMRRLKLEHSDLTPVSRWK